MAQQTINVGTVANDGTGDTWRDAWVKADANFDELFAKPAPTRTVIVNADLVGLPAAVSGQRTLADQTQYIIGDDINLGTDTIIMGQDTVFEGIDENVVTVTYSGTGVMFTAIDKSCRLKSFTANCTSGTFFNPSNSAGSEGTSNVIIDNVDVDCATLGTVSQLNILGIFRCAFNSISTAGWSFTGALGNAVTINDCTILQSAGTFLDLGTASWLSFDVNNYLMIGAGGTKFIDGAAASANIRAGGLGRVIRGRDLGGETPLTGVSVDDDRWEFFLNDSIANSRSDALMSMVDNATESVISTIDVPVLIAGTFTEERISQFTTTSAGRITYTGLKPATLPISINTVCEAASGVNKDIHISLALNGTVITGSRMAARVDASDSKSVIVNWQLQLTTGDYIEGFVENNTDTVNVIVSHAQIRVN